MHVSGKSDSLVVPEKQANKAGQPTAAESVEERRLTKENVNQSLLVRTQSPSCQVARTAWRTRRITFCSRKLGHAMMKFVSIQGRSRMRKFRTYGSVRGAAIRAVPTAIPIKCQYVASCFILVDFRWIFLVFLAIETWIEGRVAWPWNLARFLSRRGGHGRRRSKRLLVLFSLRLD
jgi:hypothetical protein